MECRYRQTEREALAIVRVWYFYGIKFYLVTLHKPFECLYSKKSRLARIERWVLLMQVFESNIEYKPGSKNISDSLARLSCCQSQEEDKKRNVAEECVRFIAKKITLKAMTTRDVEEHFNRE